MPMCPSARCQSAETPPCRMWSQPHQTNWGPTAPTKHTSMEGAGSAFSEPLTAQIAGEQSISGKCIHRNGKTHQKTLACRVATLLDPCPAYIRTSSVTCTSLTSLRRRLRSSGSAACRRTTLSSGHQRRNSPSHDASTDKGTTTRCGPWTLRSHFKCARNVMVCVAIVNGRCQVQAALRDALMAALSQVSTRVRLAATNGAVCQQMTHSPRLHCDCRVYTCSTIAS